MTKNKHNSFDIDHPEDFYKDEWVLTRKSIRTGGLIIDHQLEPPDTLEVEDTKHHIFCYFLDRLSPQLSSRQVTRIANREFDGVLKPGDIWLKPKDAPGLWHWENTDICLIFAIKP